MSGKRIACFLIFISLLTTLEAQDMGVILELAGIEQTSAPRLIGDNLLFTYYFGPNRHAGRVHSVEIAFEHEMFSTLHPFERNENEVYIFLYSLPEGRTEVRYRLVVNGIWTTDPSNPDRVEDRWGVALSRALVPAHAALSNETPVVHSDGTVEFTVVAPHGSRVSIVGSFNGWDPFMTPMYESGAGRFSRRVRLGPGEHLYYYVVDGLRLPDPGNSNRRWDGNGVTVSVVSLP